MSALLDAIVRPPAAPGFAATSPVEGLRRRSVGQAGTAAQSIAAVAPAAAATTVPALVAHSTGSGALWSVVLAVGLCLLVAVCVNQFTRRLPATGSLYTFVSRGLGPLPGLVTGVALLLGYGCIAMIAVTGAVYSLQNLVAPLASPIAGTSWVAIGLVVAGAAIAFVVLAAGIRISTAVTLIVESVSILLILVLLAGVVVGGISGARPAPSLAAPGPVDLGAGAVLAMTALVGFESASALGAESARPLRFIPRAVVFAVVVSGCLSLLAALGETIGFAAIGLTMPETTDPVRDLATASGLPWVGWALDAGVGASFFACVLASATALVRILFTMALDGVVPRAVARLAPRRRTPVLAAAVVCAGIALVPVLLIATGASLWSVLGLLLVPAAASFIVAYLLMAVAMVRFLRRIGESDPRSTALGVVTAVLLAVALVVYLAVELTSPAWFGAAAFLILLAAGSAVSIVRERRRGSGRPRPGDVYDQPTTADVLGG